MTDLSGQEIEAKSGVQALQTVRKQISSFFVIANRQLAMKQFHYLLLFNRLHPREAFNNFATQRNDIVCRVFTHSVEGPVDKQLPKYFSLKAELEAL